MKKKSVRTYGEAEEYIYSIPRFTSKHTIEDTRAFLHSLGDPDRELKIIHVAGTNGKGSVCAYLRCMLEAAGYRTAVFTSPHLVDIRERFVADGEMISREALEQDRPDAYHPSFFEFLFLMGMLYFRKKKPDYCILETGLGGRLDATNAVSGKELAVITHIGRDHMQYLGDTLEQIAAEKAGILQAGVPAVFWDTCAGTDRVFEKRASELGIPYCFVSKEDYTFSNFMNKTIDFSLRTRYYGYISLILHTAAFYQMENAALAVRALEMLDRGRTVTHQQIRTGLAACFWAGRMEEVLPEVYVDGAHNEDGIRAFLESVAEDGKCAGREARQNGRSLLFGVVKDKDYFSMAKAVADSGLFDRIAVLPLRSERGRNAGDLEKLFAGWGVRCSVFESTAAALRGLLSDRAAGERIYAAGSLYLAGEIKELVRDDKF